MQEEYQHLKVVSINPIDAAGKVASAAKSFGLPFEVAVGRGSTILSDYKITKLPHLVIIGKSGRILFFAKYASLARLKAEVEKAEKKNL